MVLGNVEDRERNAASTASTLELFHQTVVGRLWKWVSQTNIQPVDMIIQVVAGFIQRSWGVPGLHWLDGALMVV